MNEFCLCGHLKIMHKSSKDALVISTSLDEFIYCKTCAVKDIHPIIHNFKADNLKYLEQLYDKKRIEI